VNIGTSVNQSTKSFTVKKARAATACHRLSVMWAWWCGGVVVWWCGCDDDDMRVKLACFVMFLNIFRFLG
jgi:hypothetical protein